MDVLTLYCTDHRDAMELRTSETALSNRVQELQAALEGHELQVREGPGQHSWKAVNSAPAGLHTHGCSKGLGKHHQGSWLGCLANVVMSKPGRILLEILTLPKGPVLEEFCVLP